MQSLGENTIDDFMNSDDFLLPEIKKGLDNPANGITTNSKIFTGESDIGEYFKDSIVSFSESATSSSKIKLIHHKPALDVIVSKKTTSQEENENNDVLNESLELTQRNQIYIRGKLKRNATLQHLTENNAISQVPRKKSCKNAICSQQIQTLPQINTIIPSDKSLSQENSRCITIEDNNQNKDRLSGCSKISLDNELLSKCDKSASIKSALEIPSIVTTQDCVKLVYWGLPLTILRKYESRGITCMFSWQVECLSNPKIIEKYKNLVYSAPTSAGKTLVSEILVIKTVLERRKKVIFVLPFVSVVREKMYYFQELLMDSGVRVEGFMGGIHPPGGFANTDIAIATIEKANSLINQLMEDDELENVGAVVIDELHLLGDSHRGYLLELLLTKLKYMNLKKEHIHIQLIGMSATLPNLKLLANWLDAELFKTDFRPVPLQELCKIGTTIYDDKLNVVRDINPHPQLLVDADNVFQLCFETICDGHSVLIFCPTKSWCENLAQQIANTFFELGREDTAAGHALRDQLSKEAILETLEQLKRTPVGLDKVLRNTVSFGVAFHHAGLTMDERDVIEGSFRSGALRVLTATSTLSSGVNLPARRVIVRTPKFHGKTIDTLTYKQMIGRAGRMGKDTAGESILVCKPCEKSIAIKLLNSSLEPIESCLEGSNLLIRALLEAIASEVAYTEDDIATYMACTLLSSTNVSHKVEVFTKEAIEFLVKNELLLLQTAESGIARWVATPLGKACLAASVHPRDGLFLFEELQKARQCFVLDTELHVIYLVTPFNSGSQIDQIDWYIFLDLWRGISDSERKVGQLVGVKESYLVSALRGVPKQGKILDIHKRFYTALALHDLVREVPLHIVCQKYNCCRGVIQSLQQTASTFAGMVTQFCKKLGWNCIELLVSQFQARLQFGVCRELLDLLRLPMLNGLRARSLFREGITNVAELAMANELDVERALYKALPFESEKKKIDEDEDDAARRNKMRTVFVTGKDGLTPRMAALMLVREARILVQNELGLQELPWDMKDQSKQAHQMLVSRSSTVGPTVASSIHDAQGSSLHRNTSTISNNSNNSSALKNDADKNQLSSIIPNNDVDKMNYALLSEKNEMNVKVNSALKSHENKRVNDEVQTIESVKPSSYPSSQRSELCETSNEPSLPQNSKLKRSYSQSPNLFDDSLIVDTQECNILEQNLIDIDSAMFNDSVFSEPNSPPLIAQNKKSKNAEKTTIANQNESRQLVGINRSLVWEEGTWDNTKVMPGSLNQIHIADSVKNNHKYSNDLKTPPHSNAKNTEVISSTRARLGKLGNAIKQKFSSPDIVKSPIASLITYECARRLSAGSNKSDDDVVIESQTIATPLITKKTRTRMKLESLRNHTTKKCSRVQISTENLIKIKTMKDKSVKSVISTNKKSIFNDNLNSAILCSDNSSQNINCDSYEIASSKKDNVMSKENKISSSTQDEKRRLKKIDNHMKYIPKELSIVNISLDRIKFNEFKRKMHIKTDIALALACEIFSAETIVIGTKIINGGDVGYHGTRKKPKKKRERCLQ